MLRSERKILLSIKLSSASLIFGWNAWLVSGLIALGSIFLALIIIFISNSIIKSSKKETILISKEKIVEEASGAAIFNNLYSNMQKDSALENQSNNNINQNQKQLSQKNYALENPEVFAKFLQAYNIVAKSIEDDSSESIDAITFAKLKEHLEKIEKETKLVNDKLIKSSAIINKKSSSKGNKPKSVQITMNVSDK